MKTEDISRISQMLKIVNEASSKIGDVVEQNFTADSYYQPGFIVGQRLMAALVNRYLKELRGEEIGLPDYTDLNLPNKVTLECSIWDDYADPYEFTDTMANFLCKALNTMVELTGAKEHSLFVPGIVFAKENDNEMGFDLYDYDEEVMQEGFESFLKRKSEFFPASFLPAADEVVRKIYDHYSHGVLVESIYMLESEAIGKAEFIAEKLPKKKNEPMVDLFLNAVQYLKDSFLGIMHSPELDMSRFVGKGYKQTFVAITAVYTCQDTGECVSEAGFNLAYLFTFLVAEKIADEILCKYLGNGKEVIAGL